MREEYSNPFRIPIESLTWQAICQEGLLEFLTKEIQDLTLRIEASGRNSLRFSGSRSQVIRFLHSTRFTIRVALPIIQFKAWDYDDLYKKSRQIPWNQILKKYHSFKIDASVSGNLKDSRFATQRLKDSIMDQCRSVGTESISPERESPEILILLRSKGNEVGISISLTVPPMNQRGYRRLPSEAPVKETIAQALLEFSGWNGQTDLFDPMCGSGTIPIEAALRIKDPAHLNSKLLYSSEVYKALFGKEKLSEDLLESRNSDIRIIGMDADSKVLQKAEYNAKLAGVDGIIQFIQGNAKSYPNVWNLKNSHIVSNPPYGIRMGADEDLKEFYYSWGKHLKSEFRQNNLTLLAGNPSLLGPLRLKKDRELALRIGDLKGKMVHYFLQERDTEFA